MNKSKLFSLVLVAILVGSGVYLGYKQDKIVEFNDEIIAHIESTAPIFDPYFAESGKYFDGKEIDLELLHETANNIENEIKGIIADVEGMEVPGSELCAEFHNAVLEYLRFELGIPTVYRQVSEYMASHYPATMEDVQHIDNLLSDLSTKEDKLVAKMADTQKKMADKHDFELE